MADVVQCYECCRALQSVMELLSVVDVAAIVVPFHPSSRHVSDAHGKMVFEIY